MASNSESDLFSEALALPAVERARLAQKLLRSLDEDEDEGATLAWTDEILRRAREVDAGEAELVEWDEVRRRLNDRWGSR